MDQKWEYRKGKIIQIARNRGENELACKKCGAVNEVENLIITPAGKQIKASCPDCEAFIKFMAQDTVPRVYDFERKTMIYLTDAETPLLQYHLEFYKTKPELKSAIREEIERRFTVSMGE